MAKSTTSEPGQTRVIGRFRRFQFTLRSIFLLTAVIALLCVLGPHLWNWVQDPFLTVARTTSHRANCSSRLRQVAIALLSYQQFNGDIPPTYTVDSSGRRLHSWRALVLPMLEATKVHSQIHFQQPWNTPVNSAVAAMKVPIYQCPRLQKSLQILPNQTPYVAVTGPGSVWPDPAQPGVAHPVLPASEVVMLVELNGQNLPWMEPRDIDLGSLLAAANAVPPPPIFDCHGGRVNVVFADMHGQCLTAAQLGVILLKMQQTAAVHAKQNTAVPAVMP